MKHRPLLVAASLAVLTLSLTGCPSTSPPDGKPESGPAAKKEDIKLSERGAGMADLGTGRTLVGEVPALDETNVPFGGTMTQHRSADPQNLNPVTRRDYLSAQIDRLYLYPQLVRVHKDDLVLLPWMAESLPTLSEDKLTYTWRLRKGVKWLDGSGEDVKAADYVAAWEKLWDPDVDAPALRSSLDKFVGAGGMKAVDDHTFEVRMREPYFGGVYAFGVDVEPIRATKYAAMPGKDFNECSLRTEPEPFGMFKLESWTRQTELVLKRDDTNMAVFAAANVDSNLKHIHVDRLRWVFVKDITAGFEMLQRGDIDLMAMGADDWELKTKTPDFERKFYKAEYYLAQWFFIGWNLRKPMFADVRVRKALTLLTRRQEVVDTVLHGHGKLINGPHFVYSRAYDDSYAPLPYDPAEAGKLLAEAGWKDADGDGWLDKDGKKFAFELLTSNTKTPDSEALMLSFKEDAKKAGIDITIRQLEWAVFLEQLTDRKFDGASLSWVPEPIYEDDYELWHSSLADVPRSNNHVGYKNPEVDKLLEAARIEFDDDKRYAMLKQVHRIVGQDFPYTWLYCGQSLVPVSRRWENVKIHKLGVRIEEWYLAEAAAGGGTVAPPG